nr:protein FAR1-related sequence 5 [Tanacetum cinerariifolium]
MLLDELRSKCQMWPLSKQELATSMIAKLVNKKLVDLNAYPECSGSAALGSAKLGSVALGSAELGSAALRSAELGSAFGGLNG